jgi:hypothetical protein
MRFAILKLFLVIFAFKGIDKTLCRSLKAQVIKKKPALTSKSKGLN